jgi:hypothetical protein
MKAMQITIESVRDPVDGATFIRITDKATGAELTDITSIEFLPLSADNHLDGLHVKLGLLVKEFRVDGRVVESVVKGSLRWCPHNPHLASTDPESSESQDACTSCDFLPKPAPVSG